MLHKQIRFALLLSYVFVLGSSQVTTPNATLTARVEKNLCSHISYAITYFCLNDEQTYMLGFQSLKICKDVHDYLKKLPTQNASFVVNDCAARNELQATLNRETLKQVCENDGTEEVVYQQEVDLCEIIIQGESCHGLECVTNYHICDNMTEVETTLNRITEDQEYVVIFNQTRAGGRQCNRTVNKLNKLPKKLRKQNINSTIHSEACTESNKLVFCTLNLEGLKWVCDQNQVTRVTFEEKHFNESICRNITRAKELFFTDDNEFKQFNVSFFTSNADDRANCSEIVDALENPKTPDIKAIITVDNCDNRVNTQFLGRLNYEALNFVCSSADPSQATVTEETPAVIPPLLIG